MCVYSVCVIVDKILVSIPQYGIIDLYLFVSVKFKSLTFHGLLNML